MSPTIHIVEGDLLDQNVEVIVNAWNRNFIPWWLLLPQGVSAAIKRRGGYEPFRELAQQGLIPLGGAVHTTAGKLPFRGIIHVAGINMFWFATEYSIRKSVRSAITLAKEKNYRSIAFPLIGSGTGGASQQKTLNMICEEIEHSEFDGEVIIVKFKKCNCSVKLSQMVFCAVI
ncbi:MAG: macro domain-containing protein [Planctomycetaceae bacterium]|jgi:O-acetyl-ADP-ribose deacetylase (regulator of RNase III)|nr:macro domain-containing protein [Planctomycetaceae bacterium]